MLQELPVNGRESSNAMRNGGEELLERQHSSDSQTTEVQSDGLMPEQTSASSEGTDTCPPSADRHTHTLVQNEPVHQEVGDGEAASNKESDPEVEEGDSKEARLLHHDGANLTDPLDDSNCIQPTPEISNASSQLCMGNSSPTLQRDQPPSAAGLNLSSTDDHVIADGTSYGYCRPQAAPVQDTGTSSDRFMVGGDTQAGASGSTPCPLQSDVKMMVQRTDDKFNSVQFRQHTAEVGGGTPWSENSNTTNNQ